jgi:thiamine pyrophosphate-dependent acetolactate synthase large subunit-like protein
MTGIELRQLVDESGRLRRRPLIASLLAHHDGLIVTGLGTPTYNVASMGDRSENFYLWGAMGLAVTTGLGVAMALPKRRVIVVTGDGELLMGIGSLATVANVGPTNLAILVLDNQRFGETGGQTGLTAGKTNIAAMAIGAGIEHTGQIRSATDLRPASDALCQQPGPVLYVAQASSEEDPKVLPSMDGRFLAERFRRAVGADR